MTYGSDIECESRWCTAMPAVPIDGRVAGDAKYADCHDCLENAQVPDNGVIAQWL